MYGGYIKNGETEYNCNYDFNEYNGGPITYYITRDSSMDSSEAEEGYMFFLDGVPQRFSYVNEEGVTEEGGFIIISQPPNVNKEIVLNVTPKITEEMKDKEILALRLVAVTGKSKQDDDVVFPDFRVCVPMNDMKIKPILPLEIIEEDKAPLCMPVECEETVITGTERLKYSIMDGMEACVMLNTAGGSWQSMFVLPEGESTMKADCLMYGQKDYEGKYRVFFYKNNEPVKIAGGWDYIEMEIKEGYLTKCEVEFENLKNRDELLAIATL